MAPIEEGAIAEEAVVLGDLGLVAAGIELAPIAAIGTVGYGLYELGSWIKGLWGMNNILISKFTFKITKIDFHL